MIRAVMNVEEVADYLGMGTAKIYQLIEKKQIPASKIGKQYRFPKYAIDTWLNENIIMEDKEFLMLLRKVRESFQNAGYTQTDIDQAVAKVKNKKKTPSRR